MIPDTIAYKCVRVVEVPGGKLERRSVMRSPFELAYPPHRIVEAVHGQLLVFLTRSEGTDFTRRMYSVCDDRFELWRCYASNPQPVLFLTNNLRYIPQFWTESGHAWDIVVSAPPGTHGTQSVKLTSRVM